MKTKMAVVGLVSFVLGAVAAGCWFWYAYMHWMIIPKEVELAGRAGMDAVVLAHLRLNEADRAIQQLEVRMDSAVASLAQWDGIKPPSDKARAERNNWLVPVKVYRANYPCTGEVAAFVNPFLATVPDRKPDSTCKSAICRLDDLRHANLDKKTNSTTKANEPTASVKFGH